MDVKKLLLHFGNRRTPVQIPANGGKPAIEEAARTVFSLDVAQNLMLQIWSSEWDSWVDMSDTDEVPSMSKVLIVAEVQQATSQLQVIVS